MKKILFLLLATVTMYGQVPADATPLENIQITNNKTSTTATKVNVQENDGTINTISKSDLVNVIEVNDVPSLPLVGEVGKIYVVKNVNKIYRWNGTFYQELAGSDISGLQAQIDLKSPLASPTFTGTPTAPTATVGTNTTQIATTAFVTNGIATADSQNVKLTGNQTISGQKSFSLTGKIDMQTNNGFPAIMATSLGSNGGSTAVFINNSSSSSSTALNLQTSSSGGVGNRTLDVINTSPGGTGIFSNASNGGVSISSQSGNGDSYTSNITSGGTGRNYVGRNNGTETYSVDKTGNVLGNSYIKRSTPATNILLAGGGDLAQNTAFNKNFGTTAGTIVEGGTLGSNAYSSTAYLPLTGGTLNGKTGIALSSSGLNLNNSSFFINNTSNTKGGIFGYNDVDDSFYINIIEYGVAPKILKFDASQVNFSNSVTATNFNGSATLTGTPTAPTATVGTNTTQIATTAFVQANSRPYKVYTALLTQSGTSAPVATVLENTLGGTVVWTRSSTGLYNGTLTGIFTASKTVFFINQGSGASRLSGHRPDTNTVQVVSMNAYLNELVDNSINNASIEIRVYN